MIKTIVRIEGLDKLKRALASMPTKANIATNLALNKVTLDLQGKSQLLAPVNLGDLRGSAFHEVEGLDGAVGFTEPYSLRQHEEMGYRHPKGGQAKYLEQPYTENKDKYIKSIGDANREAVARHI